MGSVLDFNKAPLNSEQPTRSHCNDNQHLYIAGVKPSHAYFHLILKTVLGGSITIYTDSRRGWGSEVKWLPQGHPVIAKAESELSLHFCSTSYSTLFTPPLFDGVLCYVAGSSWRNLAINFQLGRPVLSAKPHPCNAGVTEWVSFLRSFEGWLHYLLFSFWKL